MRKRPNIKPPEETDKFTRKLIDLVTGNPIAEDYSPILENRREKKEKGKGEKVKK